MYKLEDLNPAERFVLNRRRNRLTQEAAAVDFNVTVRTVYRWEMEQSARTIPDVIITPPALSQGEACFFARRRAGMTVIEIAAQVGMAHGSVVSSEYDVSAKVTELVAFWNERGWPKRAHAGSRPAKHRRNPSVRAT